MFLDTLAGYYAGTIQLQVYLLRARSNDLTVWRALQACILIVDIAVLGGYGRALDAQNRLSWTMWRATEWSSIAVLSVVAMVRVAFLLGVGMQAKKESKRT